jgi:hypothetical protein
MVNPINYRGARVWIPAIVGKVAQTLRDYSFSLDNYLASAFGEDEYRAQLEDFLRAVHIPENEIEAQRDISKVAYGRYIMGVLLDHGEAFVDWFDQFELKSVRQADPTP